MVSAVLRMRFSSLNLWSLTCCQRFGMYPIWQKWEDNSCLVDDFDCEISSRNCKILCHSLTMVLAQTVQSLTQGSHGDDHKIITTQQMADRKSQSILSYLRWQIKVPRVPLLTLRRSRALSAQKASELDWSFMIEAVSSEQCPEWSGCSTHHAISTSVMPGAGNSTEIWQIYAYFHI